MATLGKTLVFAILALSLFCCAYGMVVYFDAINWGWKDKEAREVFGQKQPSEVAKRDKDLKELEAAKASFVPSWAAARESLAKTEGLVVSNELWYYRTLANIHGGKDIEIKDLKRGPKGELVVAADTSLPQLGGVVALKTYVGYLKVLSGLQKEIEDAKDYVKKKIEAEEELTVQLNGREDKATQKKEKGLYDLVKLEQDSQRRAKEETEELKPRYLQELVDSQLLLKRRAQLQKRVGELEALGESK